MKQRDNNKMPIIVALEGGDGTGKGTISKYVQELSHEAGLTCSIIGRYFKDSDETIAGITQLLQTSGKSSSSSKLTAQADVLLRAGREFQRAYLARNNTADVVILDRFVLSTAARARINQVNSSELDNLFLQLVEFTDLRATLLCKCPFDIAWKRVVERSERENRPLSPKELLGENYNRMLFSFLEEEFSRGVITGEQWIVDTSLALEDSLQITKSHIERVLATSRK